jgi:hypothetical protein
VIAFGITGDQLVLRMTDLRARAAQLREATGLTFPRWIKGFREANELPGDTWEL